MDYPNDDSYITKDTGRSSYQETVQDDIITQREVSKCVCYGFHKKDHNINKERACKDSRSSRRY
eukprot:snap_masked-scaffold_1-processed-gene-11.18-mRNA-1 protein AED:1.00 eAED:1.00 QI:0/-1/0/0/-1/1/1/0/63